MFRKLSRIRQQISPEECIRILKEEKRGVLSVLGDNDYPYGIPLNHYYCEEDGKIYFHSGKKGHKIEAMQAHDKVSYCVYDEGYRKEGEWSLNIRSVIVFGRIEFIEDKEKIEEISRKLSYKFTDDDRYIEEEIRRSLDKTLMFALIPEHLSGKIVNES